jgi:ribosome maturation factor RimP
MLAILGQERLLVRWLGHLNRAREVFVNSRVSELERLIGPIAEALGYDLVRVRLTGAQRPTLQVMAEKSDGTMDVDDCARLSHAISTAFEIDDPIESEYVLEVSSPGIDRPLTRRRDFETYTGHEARLDLKYPLDGRKRVRGMLKGLRGEDVVVDTELGPEKGRGELAIPYMSIGEAKLVLTDELIAHDLKRRKDAGKARAEPE